MRKILIVKKCVVALALWLMLAVTAMAQAAPEAELRVITRAVPPFVIKDGDSYTGFSVELWQAIARELGTPFHYVDKKNITEILAGMTAGDGERGDRGDFYHRRARAEVRLLAADV